jgi:hypothetical protein
MAATDRRGPLAATVEQAGWQHRNWVAPSAVRVATADSVEWASAVEQAVAVVWRSVLVELLVRAAAVVLAVPVPPVRGVAMAEAAERVATPASVVMAVLAGPRGLAAPAELERSVPSVGMAGMGGRGTSAPPAALAVVRA